MFKKEEANSTNFRSKIKTASFQKVPKDVASVSGTKQMSTQSEQVAFVANAVVKFPHQFLL